FGRGRIRHDGDRLPTSNSLALAPLSPAKRVGEGPEARASSHSDPSSLLRSLCLEELRSRYEEHEWPEAEARLEEELALIERHGLAGFFLIYRDILELGKEIARELYGPHRNRAPSRGRGSSVGSIVCYLIGLSPVDPLRNNLYLGRFLNE